MQVRLPVYGLRKIVILAGLCAVLVVAGCTSAPERTLSQTQPKFVALPNGHDPLKPGQLAVGASPGNAALIEGVIPHFERVRGHALNILQLSGGGQNGSFGAGFLKGWRARGDRPQFDIVTGISTGALLSTHAFLGTAADDAILEEIFTSISTKQVYKKRFWLSLLFAGNSMYDTAPLRALLDKYITEDVFKRVAAAYDDNRYLMVGTTNLDYRQTWVWNLTRIAKEGGPENLTRFKKILMASASPPLAFPPVEIDGYLFGDGSIRINLLLIGLQGTVVPKPPMHGPGTIFVIHNGKESLPPNAIRNDVLGIGGPALDSMMTSSMETQLLRSFAAARAHGYQFRLAAIPNDAAIGSNPLAFHQGEMRAAFVAGQELAQRPDPWQKVPPKSDDLPDWALEYLSRPNTEAAVRR